MIMSNVNNSITKKTFKVNIKDMPSKYKNTEKIG